MEINGLPAHILVVHAAVVFIPLAAVASLVYVGVPRWRWATRWLSVGLGGVAVAVVVAAYFSGKDMKDTFEARGVVPPGVNLHEERAEVLLWLTLVFFALLLAGAWGLGGPSALKSEWGARGKHDPLIEWSLVSMIGVMAIALVLMTAATGDAGAQAVWGGFLD